MYYRYDTDSAYEVKNQYIFGGQLIVAPITKPMDKRLNLGKVKVWLPEGRWTDIFSGRIYDIKSQKSERTSAASVNENGGAWVTMHRDLDSIPVLAHAGSIVPMYRNADTNDLSLDQPLEIHLWRGNGEYELYEDDGETNAYKNGIFAKTHFKLEEDENTLILTITPPIDSHGLLPTERKMHLCFRDVKAADVPTDCAGNKAAEVPTKYAEKKATSGLGIELSVTVKNEPVTVKLYGVIPTKNPSLEEHKNSILTRAQGKNDLKAMTFKKKLPSYIKLAISELEPISEE
jgi:hypothetical protein